MKLSLILQVYFKQLNQLKQLNAVFTNIRFAGDNLTNQARKLSLTSSDLHIFSLEQSNQKRQVSLLTKAIFHNHQMPKPQAGFGQISKHFLRRGVSSTFLSLQKTSNMDKIDFWLKEEKERLNFAREQRNMLKSSTFKKYSYYDSVSLYPFISTLRRTRLAISALSTLMNYSAIDQQTPLMSTTVLRSAIDLQYSTLVIHLLIFSNSSRMTSTFSGVIIIFKR